MDEYLDLIQVFFNEKHLFRSDTKHKKCIKCTDNKKFIEKTNEIILNCGKDDASKCGNKIRIILPKYIKNLSNLENDLNKMINWETINKYIDIDPNLIKGNKKKNASYAQEAEKLNELFIKLFKKQKVELINKNYKEIIDELKPDLNNIISGLHNPELSLLEITDKKHDYIKHNIRINELYNEIKCITSEYYINEENLELGDNIIDYYPFSKPEIVINDYKNEDSSEPKKKVSKKQGKPGKKLLDKGATVTFNRGNKTYEGVIEDITTNSYKICCKPGKKSGEKQSTWLVKHIDVKSN